MDDQLKKEREILKYMLSVEVFNTNRVDDEFCENKFNLNLYDTKGILFSLLRKGFLAPCKYFGVFRIKE